MNCPVCQTAQTRGGDCTVCGFAHRKYLGSVEEARSAEAARIEAARKEWHAQHPHLKADYDPNYTVDFEQDAFETVAEWKARLEGRPVYVGKATLLKEQYDIDSGRFPLEVAWESWTQAQVVAELALTLPRDQARALYGSGTQHPLYGWLAVDTDQKAWRVARLELRAGDRLHPIHVYTLAERTFRDAFLNGKGQGPVMVRLPAGTVVMGESGARLSVAAFAMGQYPVTFDEWDAALAAKGVSHRPTEYQWGRGRQPVINVNWNDACAYAAWLSQQTGKSYRLPSDTEWEYACRAGTTTAYSFGDDASLLSQYGWYKGNSEGRPHPVGGKKPNLWGLYDLHGNVCEWVADAHERGGRVLRGGSWYYEPEDARSTLRLRYDAASRVSVFGFRLARTL